MVSAGFALTSTNEGAMESMERVAKAVLVHQGTTLSQSFYGFHF